MIIGEKCKVDSSSRNAFVSIFFISQRKQRDVPGKIFSKSFMSMDGFQISPDKIKFIPFDSGEVGSKSVILN